MKKKIGTVWFVLIFVLITIIGAVNAQVGESIPDVKPKIVDYYFTVPYTAGAKQPCSITKDRPNRLTVIVKNVGLSAGYIRIDPKSDLGTVSFTPNGWEGRIEPNGEMVEGFTVIYNGQEQRVNLGSDVSANIGIVASGGFGNTDEVHTTCDVKHVSETPPPPQPPADYSTSPWIILIVVFLIVLVIMLITSRFMQRKGEDIERLFCSKCGAELKKDSAFCSKCGSEVKK